MAHVARRTAAKGGRRYEPYPASAASPSASAACSGCSCDDGAALGRTTACPKKQPPVARTQRSGQSTEHDAVQLLSAAVRLADRSLAAAGAAFAQACALPCDSPHALQALEQAEAHMAKASRTTVLAVHLASTLMQRQWLAYGGGLPAPPAPAGLPAMLLALQQQQARMQAMAEPDDGEEVSSCCTTAAL